MCSQFHPPKITPPLTIKGSGYAQYHSETYALKADKLLSRLPSSLSQFEEAIGHWRGRGGGDGQSLVDCFQDEAAVEAPSEGAEVARQMFGRDGAVGGQEAVFDIGEHGICPAEGGVSGGGAIRAGNVALVAETRLPRNALKPLPAVADDGGSGLDTGA